SDRGDRVDRKNPSGNRRQSRQPRGKDVRREVTIEKCSMAVIAWSDRVVADNDQGLDPVVGSECVDDAAHVATVTMQSLSGARRPRQSDTVQVALVTSAEVESRHDFLAGIATLVHRNGLQSQQGKGRRQQLTEQRL